MSSTQDEAEKPTPPPVKAPVVEYKMRSERRAARVAQEKIAESAKYLASNKIMATTSPPPPVKPRKRGRKPGTTVVKAANVNQASQHVGQKAAATGSSSVLQKGGGISPQIKIPLTGFKSGSGSSSVVRTTSLPIAIRPQMLAGQTLPKMPILVFNSLGTSLPTLIPIPASSLAPNTIVTLGPGGGIHRSAASLTSTNSTMKNIQQINIKSPEVVSKLTSAPSCQISTKFLRYNNTTKQSMSLTLECEEETLSSAQWSKYRKSESEYMDVLRKLTRWKGRSDVEIVHLGPDDPIPPLPRFLNVQEASRLMPTDKPNNGRQYSSMVDADVIIEMETMSGQSEALTPVIQLDDGSEKATPSPRVNVVMLPNPSSPTTAPAKQSKAQSYSKDSASSSSPTKRPGIGTLPLILKRAPLVKNIKAEDVVIPKTTEITITAIPPVVDTTTTPAADSSINLAPGYRQYPELLVKLNTQKLVSSAHISVKKLKLDAFMKKLIQSGKPNVERWMLEKGLFGVNRICLFHPKLQMKLMFMSNPTSPDATPKPVLVGAGGSYKWWCHECASMMAVDQGSFFAKWHRSHSAILRVIYHWACNSDVRLVIQEMRGDKGFVGSVYAAIRTVCAKQSFKWRIGGAGHPVEIAQEDLGVCKDVVDVSLYCAYDRLTRHVKLGASSAVSLKSKMASLFRVLVDKESFVVGSKALTANLPPHFRDNFVCNSDRANQIVNLNAIAYLRDFVVPAIKELRAELKLESIQRLLDELAWREKFGRDPLNAYNSILSHIKQSFVSSVITTVKSPQAVTVTSPSAELKATGIGAGTSLLKKNRLAPDPEASGSASASGGVTSPTAVDEVPIEDQLEEVVTDEQQEDKLGEKQEEVIVVDCDLAASIEVEDQNCVAVEQVCETQMAAKVKRRLTGVDAEGAPSSKDQAPRAKKFKGYHHRVSADQSSNYDYINVSYWMPPIGVQLESYYYATKEGQYVPPPSAVVKKTPCPASCSTPHKSKYKFKCHACKKSLEDNTKMMKHMHGHINALKQFNLDLSDLTHCRFCFREFASPYAMQTHVEEVHGDEPPASPVCRICDKEFVDVESLCQHMKSSHVQSEMPYKCLVCKFRTSFYKDIMLHFEEMHGGTNKLLCIHCLHVFTVRFGQEGLTYGFYRHVYKHQSKSINRHCPSCCLSFLSSIELQEHRNTDHCSFAKQSGVKPVTASSKSKSIYIDLGFSPEGTISKKERKLLCMECKSSVHKPFHFKNTLRCSKCPYVTCCVISMRNHAIAFHSIPPPVRSHLTKYPAVVSELSCVCNFMSTNGDDMAKHLSKCEKKWCYFTGDTDSSNSSSFKVDLGRESAEDEEREDDVYENDESNAAEESTLPMNDVDQHNMMNVLGLMRVNPRRRLRTKSTASS